MTATSILRPRRSALFMPATNTRALEKARSLPADVIFIDLEDAVGPQFKQVARDNALAALTQGGFGRREVVVRCNGLDTPWGRDDCTALVSSGADGLLVPKIAEPRQIAACRALMPGGPPLWLMIETAAAMLSLRELAEASRTHGVAGWVLGTNDLGKEMRTRPAHIRATIAPMLPFALAAARSAGVSILDAVFNDFSDAEGFARECMAGADAGFDGKALIHPAQIGPANAAFRPTARELQSAAAVVAAFALPENAGAGVINVAGRMVERLHFEEAEALLALAAAIGPEV